MENYLPMLSRVVPESALRDMRKISDLKDYMPFTAGGLTVRWDDSIRGDTAAGRMGAFTHLSNTPAVQNLTKAYDPRHIVKLAKERCPRNYDEELKEWEGEWEDVLKARGGRNPFHLLEQVLIMGPTGDPVKRGPTPMNWEIFYKAVDDLIEILKARLGTDQLMVKHMAIGTPKSALPVLKFAHVMTNSAGEPFLSDPNTKRTAKKYHVAYALRAAQRFLGNAVTSLPKWPSLVFARGDRAAAFENFLDTEASRSRAVFDKRDRKIDAQSFILQLNDGIFTQALADAISTSPVPEIDIREPTMLSNHFVEGGAIMQRLGEDAFSIGRDESSWDQHVTPQGWYACYLIYRELFASRQECLIFHSDAAGLHIEPHHLESLSDLAPGNSRVMTFIAQDGQNPYEAEVEVTKVTFDTDTVLRRIFAGMSGTDARLGNVVVEGMSTVIHTPRDGKFLCGWSQRSGNFSTFLSNCLINWHKTLYIQEGSRDPDVLSEFEALHGYVPPPMTLEWLVVRGDDAADIWNVPDRSEDWKISELIADWLTLTGGLANAKKQDTSDERGRWRVSFAQLFVSENFPRGVSSIVRILERNIWNEADEVVAVNPDDGEDLRSVLQLMNTYGRVNNAWGVWNREVHPCAAELTDLLQDLDSDRLLPPLDEEERRKAATAYALKLLRRGQIAASQIDEAIRHFWSTELAQYALNRYDRTPKLKDHSWSPLKRYGEDARPVWRS